MEKVLLYFVIKYQGNWDQVYHALDSKEKIALEELHTIEKKIDCQYLTILSSQYPAGLKTIYKPPFVIFYVGNIDLLKHSQKMIAVTGGHILTSYIEKITDDLILELARRNKILVTGLKGDTEFLINYLLKANKISDRAIVNITNFQTLTIQQKELLQEIKQNHLLISEIPIFDTMTGEASDFHASERIIIGIARDLLVLPFNKEKNIIQLIEHAVSENKNIFAIPNQIYQESGTNQIIKNNAKLVQTIDDIL